MKKSTLLLVCIFLLVSCSGKDAEPELQDIPQGQTIQPQEVPTIPEPQEVPEVELESAQEIKIPAKDLIIQKKLETNLVQETEKLETLEQELVTIQKEIVVKKQEIVVQVAVVEKVEISQKQEIEEDKTIQQELLLLAELEATNQERIRKELEAEEQAEKLKQIEIEKQRETENKLKLEEELDAKVVEEIEKEEEISEQKEVVKVAKEQVKKQKERIQKIISQPTAKTSQENSSPSEEEEEDLGDVTAENSQDSNSNTGSTNTSSGVTIDDNEDTDIFVNNTESLDPNDTPTEPTPLPEPENEASTSTGELTSTGSSENSGIQEIPAEIPEKGLELLAQTNYIEEIGRFGLKDEVPVKSMEIQIISDQDFTFLENKLYVVKGDGTEIGANIRSEQVAGNYYKLFYENITLPAGTILLQVKGISVNNGTTIETSIKTTILQDDTNFQLSENGGIIVNKIFEN